MKEQFNNNNNDKTQSQIKQSKPNQNKQKYEKLPNFYKLTLFHQQSLSNVQNQSFYIKKSSFYSINNLARSYLERSEFDKASNLYSKALAIFTYIKPSNNESAVKDNELISAHKNNQKAKKTEVRHILPKMVRCAFKNGAVFGDCYGEFLADYYMKSGFIVACKINFDADGEFVPPTWNYEKHGRPDVYLMMKGVKNVAELDRLKTKRLVHGFDLVEEFVPRFKTYDEAAQFRLDLYNSVKAYGYKNRALMVREYLKNYKNSSR